MKRKATDRENICAKTYLIKDHYPTKYKELLKLHNKRMNNLIKKWVRDLNRHLTKGDISMASKYMKTYSTPYVIREVKTEKRPFFLFAVTFHN